MAKVYYVHVCWFDDYDSGEIHEAFSEDADKLVNWLQERMQNIAPTWTSQAVQPVRPESSYKPELSWIANTENCSYEAVFGELNLIK